MRKLPPLAELRAFEAAARHMSFKKAADELAVTPPAISHQIRQLEQRCGAALFRRRPRPLSLTPAGAILFPVVRDGLDAFAEAFSAIGWQPRVLRVTTTNAFAGKWLVPRLSGWREEHPHVTLEVVGTDAVLDLQAGEADLAIRNAQLAPAGLVARELFRGRFVAVCRPDLLDGGPLPTPAALRGRTLLHSYWSPADPEAPTWQRWLDAASAFYDDVPALAEMNHLNFREELHAIEGACHGQGILIVSDILVEREIADGTLVRAMGFTLPGYGFYATLRPEHPDRPLIDTFLAWLDRSR